MQVHVLDLDGGVRDQETVFHRYGPTVVPLCDWGPRIRLACSFGRFRRFARALPRVSGPALTLYGSGDFHHVSLALVRRLDRPVNLLVLDNHPDWMRGVPFLHCGTWLYHAARLPQVQRIFHVGGDVDFDNGYRWLAPWRMIRSRRVVVWPAVRRYLKGGWCGVGHEPVRPAPAEPADAGRLRRLLRPWREELRARPLYVSLDKDVLREKYAAVNWDSGHLTLAEVQAVLEAFLQASDGRLAGMDIVGDRSPVVVRGVLRRALHFVEHPPLSGTWAEAAARNEATNLELLGALMDCRERLVG